MTTRTAATPAACHARTVVRRGERAETGSPACAASRSGDTPLRRKVEPEGARCEAKARNKQASRKAVKRLPNVEPEGDTAPGVDFEDTVLIRREIRERASAEVGEPVKERISRSAEDRADEGGGVDVAVGDARARRTGIEVARPERRRGRRWSCWLGANGRPGPAMKQLQEPAVAAAPAIVCLSVRACRSLGVCTSRRLRGWWRRKMGGQQRDPRLRWRHLVREVEVEVEIGAIVDVGETKQNLHAVTKGRPTAAGCRGNG